MHAIAFIIKRYFVVKLPLNHEYFVALKYALVYIIRIEPCDSTRVEYHDVISE